MTLQLLTKIIDLKIGAHHTSVMTRYIFFPAQSAVRAIAIESSQLRTFS